MISAAIPLLLALFMIPLPFFKIGYWVYFSRQPHIYSKRSCGPYNNAIQSWNHWEFVPKRSTQWYLSMFYPSTTTILVENGPDRFSISTDNSPYQRSTFCNRSPFRGPVFCCPTIVLYLPIFSILRGKHSHRNSILFRHTCCIKGQTRLYGQLETQNHAAAITWHKKVSSVLSMGIMFRIQKNKINR